MADTVVVDPGEVPAAEAVAPEDAALWAEFDTADKASAKKDGEEVVTEAAVSGNAADAAAADAQVTGEEKTATAAAAAAATTGADKGAAKPKADAVVPAKDAAATGAKRSDDPDRLDDATLAALPETARNRLIRLETADRAHRGRQSAAARIEQENTRLKSEVETLKKSNTPAVGADGKPIEIKEWKDLADTYPEIAAGVEAKFGREVKELRAQLAATQASTDSVVSKMTDADVTNQINILAETHPDWAAAVGEKGFGDFVKAGPQYVRDIYSRNSKVITSAEETAVLITAYKAQRQAPAPAAKDTTAGGGSTQQPGGPAKPAAKRARQLEGAASPSAGANSRIPVTGIPADGLSDAEMWAAHEKAGL